MSLVHMSLCPSELQDPLFQELQAAGSNPFLMSTVLLLGSQLSVCMWGRILPFTLSCILSGYLGHVRVGCPTAQEDSREVTSVGYGVRHT